MGKRGRNLPKEGHFRVQGKQVEDREATGKSKSALGRAAAKQRRRAGRKTALGPAPKEQRAAEPPAPKTPPSSKVAEQHRREFARMNERRPQKRVKRATVAKRARAEASEQPRYFGDRARDVIRRMARVAFAPLALARAVVERFRDRE